MTRDDLILQTLEPVTHDLGGFKVHRTLPPGSARWSARSCSSIRWAQRTSRPARG